MHSTNLIKILKNFSKDEIKEFGKFVESPYFNTSEATKELFTELKKFYPEFSGSGFTREKLFESVYGRRKFSNDLFRKLLSNLIILAEEFIFINDKRQNKALKVITILDKINQYGTGSSIEKKLKELEEIISQRGVYADHLKDRADLNRIKYNYYITNNRFREGSEMLNKYGDYTLSQFMQSFADIYKLKMQVISSYKHPGNYDAFSLFFENFDIDKFSKDIERLKISDYNTLRESYLLIRLNKDLDDHPAYNELKKMVFINITNYDHAYACRVITALLNFGLSRIIHKKDTAFYKELFSLYKFSLENGNLLSFHNKFMNLVTYRNILYIAIEVKEYEWVKGFIKKYIGLVNADNKDSLENISLGIISFETGDYSKTLEHIMKLKFDHEIFKIDVKNILMKTYYELGYYETAISTIDATKHLLSGGINISEGVRNLHLTFIGYYSELLNIRLKYDDFRHQKLIKELKENDSVLSREWLLNKAAALK